MDGEKKSSSVAGIIIAVVFLVVLVGGVLIYMGQVARSNYEKRKTETSVTTEQANAKGANSAKNAAVMLVDALRYQNMDYIEDVMDVGIDSDHYSDILKQITDKAKSHFSSLDKVNWDACEYAQQENYTSDGYTMCKVVITLYEQGLLTDKAITSSPFTIRVGFRKLDNGRWYIA